MDSEGNLPHSQEPTTCPYPERLSRTLYEVFPNGS